jgi:hypothetical protein
MGESRSVYRVLVGKIEDPDLGQDGRKILEDGMWRPGLH